MNDILPKIKEIMVDMQQDLDTVLLKPENEEWGKGYDEAVEFYLSRLIAIVDNAPVLS